MTKAVWLPSKTSWGIARVSDASVVMLCESQADADWLAESNPNLTTIRVRRAA